MVIVSLMEGANMSLEGKMGEKKERRDWVVEGSDRTRI